MGWDAKWRTIIPIIKTHIIENYPTKKWKKKIRTGPWWTDRTEVDFWSLQVSIPSMEGSPLKAPTIGFHQFYYKSNVSYNKQNIWILFQLYLHAKCSFTFSLGWLRKIILLAMWEPLGAPTHMVQSGFPLLWNPLDALTSCLVHACTNRTVLEGPIYFF